LGLASDLLDVLLDICLSTRGTPSSTTWGASPLRNEDAPMARTICLIGGRMHDMRKSQNRSGQSYIPLRSIDLVLPRESM
jgi:hypothetical protein